MTKAIKAGFILCAVAAASFASAVGVDLKNEDGKRYEVKVYDGGTTRNTWIDANSTVVSICSSCEVEVVGAGKFRVSGSDKLSIKNGKLVKQ